VAISGCPNGCAQSAVADIGLIGRITTDNGRKRQSYDLLVGGDMGRNRKLARGYAKKLYLPEIVGRIVKSRGGDRHE